MSDSLFSDRGDRDRPGLGRARPSDDPPPPTKTTPPPAPSQSQSQSSESSSPSQSSSARPPMVRRPAPPSRQRARQPFRWARRLLLVVGLLIAASLVVLLAAYNFGRVDDDEAPAAVASEDGTVRRGKQIDFEQTSGGETLFRVRADESIETADDLSRLVDVVVDLYGEDDRVYTITSDEAQIDQKNSAATFDGNVEVSGWESLRLLTRSLKLAGGGSRMASPGTAEFHWEMPDGSRLVGRASTMHIDRDRDVLALSGGVHVRSTPGAETPIRLDCERLEYNRGDRLFRAMDDVAFQWGDQQLETHALTVFLREDGQTLSLLRARWDVRGSLIQDDGSGAATTVAFGAQLLEVEPNEENPEFRKTTLDGGGDEDVFLSVVQPDGTARRLEGAKLEARSLESRLVQVEGFGNPLQLVEYLDLPEPWLLRRTCSDRGSASFQDDGTIGRLVLEGQVELRDEELTVSGAQRAVIDSAKNRLDVTGDPAVLYAERGELQAPSIGYARDQGILRASGGVEATLPADSAAALDGAPFTEGQGPVRIVSNEAVWTETPESFTFDGDVRAWRGTNLLLAEQLRGDAAGRTMSASGGVQTVWTTERAGASADDDGPIQITAALLTYEEGGGLITYSDDVRVAQGERLITCDQLRVAVTSEGSAERMACLGDVTLDDPAEGQKVTGEQAVYAVDARRIEIAGDVVLVDGSGNRLTGGFLTYDLATARTRMRSRRPDDALQPPGGPVTTSREKPDAADDSTAADATGTAPVDPVS